jgi:uncharacterized membrane protein YdjX (TVP38/TMEM64 family)
MSPSTARPPSLPLLRIGGAALVIAAAAYAAYSAGWFEYEFVTERARAIRRRSTTVPAALMFVGAWAVLTPLAFPAVPLIVAGGAIFGTVLGAALNLAGTLLGALGGYFVARLVAPPRLRRWMTAHIPGGELRPESGFGALVRLRLVPVVPFSTINYASGLARIRLRVYLASTAAGQLPSILLYSWFADRLLREAATGGSVARQLALISGALFVMSLSPWLLRRVRRA